MPNMPSIVSQAVKMWDEMVDAKRKESELNQKLQDYVNNPDEIKKKLYPHQQKAWDYLVKGGKRAILVWHRRSGKDITALHWVVYSALKRVGTYWYILPTAKLARRNIWEGKTIDGRKYLDIIPDEFVLKYHETNMAVYLKNGSIIQFLTAESYDTNIRGGNALGVVLSEYSFMSPRLINALNPIMSPKGHEGWILFVFTPCGKNHAWDLYKSDNAGWYKELLTVNDTTDFFGDRIISDAFIDEERNSQAEEIIQREYYCSFEAGIKGTYYLDELDALAKHDRLRPIVYDPLDSRGSKVYTSWDLGMVDKTVIWFFQQRGDYLYFIDYYENSGKITDFYLNILLEKQRQYGYIYGGHILPHDAARRDYVNLGQNRYNVISGGASKMRLGRVFMGAYFPLNDGIDKVKKYLSRCYIDSEKCAQGILALKQYRQKEIEVQDTYVDRPVHDWTSHAADAFRYAIVHIVNFGIVEKYHQPKTYL